MLHSKNLKIKDIMKQNLPDVSSAKTIPSFGLPSVVYEKSNN